MNKKTPLSRRQIISGAAAIAGTSTFSQVLPAWAQSGPSSDISGLAALSGKSFDLNVSRSKHTIDGRSASAVLVNGHLPAPLLRWREGDEVTLRVTNHLSTDTSIHWHGILLPFQMDGVPGVTFPGIKPGETFTYQFPLVQSGTYWYHSHSGLQEQLGHYGPIVIEPRDRDRVAFDREYVIVLSDWTFEDPHRVFAKLKKMSDNYNFQQRTVSDFFDDVEDEGLDRTLAERMMWGAMRMNPTDIADVTSATYTYLINGHAPTDNWTALFEPGERIRLRFINAAAMSIFNVRIPGLPVTVVQADGLDVQPVEVDEFQIGTAETFDVIVQPRHEGAYTIVAESNDRGGYARATLSSKMGLRAQVPTLRQRPTLTMKDMAMDHGDHAMEHNDSGASEMDHAAMGHSEPAPTAMDHAAMGHSEPAPTAMDHAAMGHSEPTPTAMDHAAMGHSEPAPTAMDHAAMGHSEPAPTAMDHAAMGHGDPAPKTMDHAAMGHSESPAESSANHTKKPHDISGMESSQTHDHAKGPGVVGLAMNPVNRLSERPNGLEDVPHRVLVYTDLRSLDRNPDTRAPIRTLELHLTSNMERYMWSFDGLKFSEVDTPILFYKGERLRLTLVNDTMMPHPIHLHGMFFDVVTAEHHHKPRKHTIVVKPGEKMSVDITAEALGDWAFHCHLLYHMHAGMMRVVSVVDAERPV